VLVTDAGGDGSRGRCERIAEIVDNQRATRREVAQGRGEVQVQLSTVYLPKQTPPDTCLPDSDKAAYIFSLEAL